MTTLRAPALIGLFEDRFQAELAVDELLNAGFDSGDVAFALRGHEVMEGGMITDSLLTKDKEGAMRGVLIGAAAGALLGCLAAFVVPGGLPPQDSVLPAILGFGAAGVAVGGLLGAMAGLGRSEREALDNESVFPAGRAVVIVQAGTRPMDARRILRRHGGHHIHIEPAAPAETLPGT